MISQGWKSVSQCNTSQALAYTQMPRASCKFADSSSAGLMWGTNFWVSNKLLGEADGLKDNFKLQSPKEQIKFLG